MGLYGNTLGQPAFFMTMNLPLSPKDPDYHKTSTFISTGNGIFYGAGFFGTLFTSWVSERWGRVQGFRVAALFALPGAALQAGAVNQGMVSLLNFGPPPGIHVLVRLWAPPRSITDHDVPTLVPCRANHLWLCCWSDAGSHVDILLGGQSPTKKRHALWPPCLGNRAWRLLRGLDRPRHLFQKGQHIRLAVSYRTHDFNSHRADYCDILLLVFSHAGRPARAYMVSVPETPRWLMRHDRQDAALEILRKLHGSSMLDGGHVYEREYEQIRLQSVADVEATKKYGKWQLFTDASYRKRLIVTTGLIFFGNGTGFLVIYSEWRERSPSFKR